MSWFREYRLSAYKKTKNIDSFIYFDNEGNISDKYNEQFHKIYKIRDDIDKDKLLIELQDINKKDTTIDDMLLSIKTESISSTLHIFSQDDKAFLDEIDKNVSSIIKERDDAKMNELIHELEKCKIQIDSDISKNIKDSYYFKQLVSCPQSIATIRGNTLNKMIYDIAIDTFKDIPKSNYTIIPECNKKKLSSYDYKTFEEDADLYIQYNDKELYIYNQMDLWNGGAQFNRCHHYLNINDNRMLCIVINPCNITKRSKYYNLIKNSIKSHKLIWASDFVKYLELWMKDK